MNFKIHVINVRVYDHVEPYNVDKCILCVCIILKSLVV